MHLAPLAVLANANQVLRRCRVSSLLPQHLTWRKKKRVPTVRGCPATQSVSLSSAEITFLQQRGLQARPECRRHAAQAKIIDSSSSERRQRQQQRGRDVSLLRRHEVRSSFTTSEALPSSSSGALPVISATIVEDGDDVEEDFEMDNLEAAPVVTSVLLEEQQEETENQSGSKQWFVLIKGTTVLVLVVVAGVAVIAAVARFAARDNDNDDDSPTITASTFPPRVQTITPTTTAEGTLDATMPLTIFPITTRFRSFHVKPRAAECSTGIFARQVDALQCGAVLIIFFCYFQGS